MNLDILTEGQRQSVTHVKGPLLISAGAGSGKTFTLTQRIAYALLSAKSDVADIDEVLAITFTEKAAGEIKARVKNTLRQEGLSDQALKVDGAWISTIHGMCSRILRTHALELGIDPGFGIIDDSIRNKLITEAINEAVGDDNEIISRNTYEKLFDEFPVRSTFSTVPSVVSLLETLLGKAANLKQGLSDITFCPKTRPAETIARELLHIFEGIAPYLEEAGTSKTAESARAKTEEAQEILRAFLSGERDTCDESSDNSVELCLLQELAQHLDTLIFIPSNIGNTEVKAAIKSYQQNHSRIINEVILGLAAPILHDLVALAGEVVQIYEEKKQALYAFDNDDLLLKTARAFDEHPGIAELYAQKFKLVMVDEFQDTSQIQIDIIEKLAGANKAHLCTVGDSQQSIYRFRGADVKVYESHKKSMCSPETAALSIELSKNFRSHDDILSFVDRIFEQPQVFGDTFMSLSPDEGRSSGYLGTNPRIDVVLAARPSGVKTGISVDDSTWAEARGVATRFAALRAAGHKAGDMVVLLGKMTRANIFAQALRDQDFECVITGGSLFDQAPEVHVLCRLAEALANPSNTAALFEVLASDMFCLGADDFLELSTREDSGHSGFRRCDLHLGFLNLVKVLEGQDDSSPSEPLRLHHAVQVLDKAWKSLRSSLPSRVIYQAILDSGWMTRLDAEGAFGIARAGNILKAIRMLESLETDLCGGIAQVAFEFSNRLAEGLKEAPGALTGAESQVVKIMTIHASKGLEFPIVALAEFYGVRPGQNALLVETCNGKTYASLSLRESLNKYKSLAKYQAKYSLDTDEEAANGEVSEIASKQTAAEFRAVLKASAQAEELAEARRKFYVGLTRASEALIVSFSVRSSSKTPLNAYKDIIDDVRSALCGINDFPTGKDNLEYGGSQPAAFERIEVLVNEDAGNLRSTTETFAIPVVEERPLLPRYSANILRERVFSYSSLGTSEETFDADPSYSEASDGSCADVLASCRELSEGLSVVESISRSVASGFNASCTAAFPSVSLGENELRHNTDVEKATSLGTAFHRLAQYAIETREVPDVDRIEACAKVLLLTADQKVRLQKALSLWFSSTLFAELGLYPFVQAEVPFYLPIDDLYLEGEIDLFCTYGKDQVALIVDYKTGGKPEETSQVLYKKHLLQASCYAYVVLTQGYPQVDLIFVRVEQPQAGLSDPETIEYSWIREDMAELKQRIIKAYQSKHR